MLIENNGDDGSDIFWPGYVDAVTNLVLNLLFLLTIMTSAVFIFALQLGREAPGQKPEAEKAGEVAIQPLPEIEQQRLTDPLKEKEIVIADLKKQVEALKREAQLPNDLRMPQKVVTATSAVPKPEKGLDRAVEAGGGIVVRFEDDAVMLTEAETKTLRDTLREVVASGGARINVATPSGFSEARRLGFYRAMAVRNLLIEMKIRPDKIEVAVREGNSNANASLVRVMPR